LVAGLAASTSLLCLFIEFNSSHSLPNQNSLPPVTRTVLPALSTIEFEGASDYLEDLVARIDCPKLEHNKISYLHRCASFRAARLMEFMDRLENPRLRQIPWLDVHFLSEGIFLWFSHLHHMGFTWITFKGTKWGVSHLIQMFRQFSPKLSEVCHLSIKYDPERPPGPEIGPNEWVQLLHPFTTVQTLHVKDEVHHDPPAVEGVTREIVPGADSELLPALGLLYLECGPQVAYLAFLENFVAARRLSSCPVTAVKCQEEFHKRMRPYTKEERDNLSRMFGLALEAT
jgi:hypothetical protein